MAIAAREKVSVSNMSEVWMYEEAGERRAVKVLGECHRNSTDMRVRFERERRIHQSLRHDNIVPVVASDEAGALATKWLNGPTLERLIAGVPLPIPRAIEIALQVLDALDYCHQNGVLHRDVKPANIMLEQDRAYLIDFGVACYLAAPQARMDLSGTAAYMSPEQIQAPASADQRSDVYGFGCVLYEMLTGRPPFPLDAQDFVSDDQIKFMQISTIPISPRALNPAIDEPLERIVLTALAKRPEQRFAGCGSFALALRNLTAPRTTFLGALKALVRAQAEGGR
jgi:serine/threonine-protein kinase